ncbi:hypothetical protein C2W64_03445 [Brevibacillus laterosporus]|nr:hypothetical protein C2W64_03445 [Brevibacillus laterosporus]
MFQYGAEYFQRLTLEEDFTIRLIDAIITFLFLSPDIF